MIVGDVVRLKSGGPWMTVTAVNAGTSATTCVWFLPINGSAPDFLYASAIGTAMFAEAMLEVRPVEPAPAPEVRASEARTSSIAAEMSPIWDRLAQHASALAAEGRRAHEFFISPEDFRAMASSDGGLNAKVENDINGRAFITLITAVGSFAVRQNDYQARHGFSWDEH